MQIHSKLFLPHLVSSESFKLFEKLHLSIKFSFNKITKMIFSYFIKCKDFNLLFIVAIVTSSAHGFLYVECFVN